MKFITILPLIFAATLLTSCASNDKVDNDTFWVGCMNAALYFSPNNMNKPISERRYQDIVDKWCVKQYNKVTNQSKPDKISRSDH